jgi:transcriptional regulator with XRE-family HTH domain
MSKKDETKPNEIQEIFSANIRRLRKTADITQLVLAKKAGLTYNFINDIENGKKWVSPETLSKLSKALEVEPYHFFLSPVHCSKAEDLPIIGIIETLNKNVNKIFECSIKEFTGGDKGKDK